MKNLFFSKLNLIVCFLLLSLSVQAADKLHPLKVNWLNPMNSNQAENLIGGRIYLSLNDDGSMQVNLTAVTTDNDMTGYDELRISYDFEGLTDDILVTNADFVEVETGIYEATFLVTLDFKWVCETDPDGLYPIDITLALTTPKPGGGYTDYPFSTNTGLFDPAEYESLVPGVNIVDKVLVCPGATPPVSMVTNNDNQVAQTTPSSMKTTESESLSNVSLYQENQQEDIVERYTVRPNPFTDAFQLEYKLDAPSDVEVLVMDITGQKIIYQKYPDQAVGLHRLSFTFDSDLPAGLYTLHFLYSDQIKSTKLVRLKRN